MEIKCYSSPGSAMKLQGGIAKSSSDASNASYKIELEIHTCRECRTVGERLHCTYCKGSGIMDWVSMMKYGFKSHVKNCKKC